MTPSVYSMFYTSTTITSITVPDDGYRYSIFFQAVSYAISTSGYPTPTAITAYIPAGSFTTRCGITTSGSFHSCCDLKMYYRVSIATLDYYDAPSGTYNLTTPVYGSYTRVFIVRHDGYTVQTRDGYTMASGYTMSPTISLTTDSLLLSYIRPFRILDDTFTPYTTVSPTTYTTQGFYHMIATPGTPGYSATWSSGDITVYSAIWLSPEVKPKIPLFSLFGPLS